MEHKHVSCFRHSRGNELAVVGSCALHTVVLQLLKGLRKDPWRSGPRGRQGH